MTKSIKSYPESERPKVVARRLKSKTGGLGYVSAVEAEKHMAKAVATAKKADETAGE